MTCLEEMAEEAVQDTIRKRVLSAVTLNACKVQRRVGAVVDSGGLRQYERASACEAYTTATSGAVYDRIHSEVDHVHIE